MDSNITIIGAGVVGLAVASELADEKKSIFVLEKNACHGLETSSRNSEVVHAGIYYSPGSLKARLCVEGREMLYEICSRHGIPHLKTGKLIISTTEEGAGALQHLFENARTNGIASVSMLDQAEVNRLEPNIKAFAAIHSPETGIVSVHALMDYFLHRAKERGAELVCGTEVVGIESVAGGFKVATRNSRGELFEFTTEMVVNSAGLHSDTIAGMAGRECSLHYCKGDYFSLASKTGLVRRLVYPLPEKDHVGLGVHLTLDLQGRMKLGPDAAYTDRVENYRVDAGKGDMFYQSAVRFLPFLRREDLVPDMSGIRPKLQGPGEGFRDFVISEDLPGFINLVGIESPGLTAAPAIARHVRRILNGEL
jgi:L-2-hydroxyglutarate oxidase LhgO